MMNKEPGAFRALFPERNPIVKSVKIGSYIPSGVTTRFYTQIIFTMSDLRRGFFILLSLVPGAS